jgi:hypothetical protein
MRGGGSRPLVWWARTLRVVVPARLANSSIVMVSTVSATAEAYPTVTLVTVTSNDVEFGRRFEGRPVCK